MVFSRFQRPKSDSPTPPVLEDSDGLSILVDPGDKRDIDLIFIHGLGGLARSTWSHEGKPENFWPKEWLPKVTGMETARIMVWGYNAPMNPLGDGTTMNVSRFASNLLNELSVNDLDVDKTNPVVFVCHSMGGLIAKQAVIKGTIDPKSHEIINNVKGMLFFGTPHRGANLANVAVHLENLFRALQLKGSRQYIKDLVTHSILIEEMNEDFKHHLNRLMIHSFYEEHPTSSIGNVVVVPLASAIINAPTETFCGINGDHISMCKYTSETSPQYQVAARNISQMVRTIRNTAQSAVSESTSLAGESTSNTSIMIRPSPPTEVELEVAPAQFPSGVSTVTAGHGSGIVIISKFGDVKDASIRGVGNLNYSNFGGIHPSLTLSILILSCLFLLIYYPFRLI